MCMNPQLYAIDNGYGDTKFKAEKVMAKFKSKIQETSDKVGNDTIEVDGIMYKFGSGQDDIELLKTHKQVHRVCALAAMATVMGKEESAEVNLVLGMPLMQQRNKDQREEFQEYIAKPGKTIEVKYNGQPKKITVRNSVVVAQGGAALYADIGKLDEYKKRLTAVIDWGRGTVSGFICEGLNPIPESMFTVMLGTTVLTSRITTAINSRHGLNVQDYEMPYIMNEMPKHLCHDIIEAEDAHFDEIIKVMRKKNWSVETLNMLGLGGGFIVTKNIVRRYFDKLEIAHNPVYANVLGKFNIGGMIWK